MHNAEVKSLHSLYKDTQTSEQCFNSIQSTLSLIDFF